METHELPSLSPKPAQLPQQMGPQKGAQSVDAILPQAANESVTPLQSHEITVIGKHVPESKTVPIPNWKKLSQEKIFDPPSSSETCLVLLGKGVGKSSQEQTASREEVINLIANIGTAGQFLGFSFDLVASAMEMASVLAQKVAQIGRTILSGAQMGRLLAGSAASGVGIVFGGVQSFLGIHSAIIAYKEKKSIDKRAQFLRELPDSPNGIEDLLVRAAILKAEQDRLIATKTFRNKILRACGGALVTVSGALGIAAALTSGVAATGIAVAAGVVSIIGIGISVLSWYQSRQIKKEMSQIKLSRADLTTLINYLGKVEGEEKKVFIAKARSVLGIDNATNIETALGSALEKLLPTVFDSDELAVYLSTDRNVSKKDKAKFAKIIGISDAGIENREESIKGILRRFSTISSTPLSDPDVQTLATYFRLKKGPSNVSKQEEEKKLEEAAIEIFHKHTYTFTSDEVKDRERLLAKIIYVTLKL